MNKNLIDLTGQKIHKWTVLGFHGYSKNRMKLWTCLCECGNSSIVYQSSLRSNRSKQCRRCQNRTHGQKKTKTWKSWSSMNEKHKKGFKICERWQGQNGFINFLQDMGKRPDNMSLHIKENQNFYSKENCFWSKILPSRTTHGMTGSPTYISWISMIVRCTKPQDGAYKYYGGRGITVCDRWQGKCGFENFLADMGVRPKDKCIDRINNDKNYDKKNCKWSTDLESARNRRCIKLSLEKARLIRREHAEGVLNIELAQEFNVSPPAIRAVIKHKIWQERLY